MNQRLKVGAFLSLSTVGLIACSPTKFKSNSKSAVISQSSVFSNEHSEASGTLSQPGTNSQPGTSNAGGSVTQPAKDGSLDVLKQLAGNLATVGGERAPANNVTHYSLPSPLPAPTRTEISYLYMCSFNQMSRSNGVSLAVADYLELSLTDRATGHVCTDANPSLLTKLKTNKTIDFATVYADCAAQSSSFNPDNLQVVHITGGKGSSRATLDNTEGGITNVVAKVGNEFKMTESSSCPGTKWSNCSANPHWTTTSGQARPSPGNGYIGTPYVFFDGTTQFQNATTDGEACDYSLSPLIIRLSEEDGGIDLTSPFEGKFFDILGLNSFPMAHTKKLISWFAHTADYFLVLPDSDGQVHGIDQLFGNNTFGPDGNFAADGYAALAKYDGRDFDGSFSSEARDSFINRKDPVFPLLALWRDDNLDAIAQPEELHSLDQMGVEEIDLNYDANFVETDRYGNQTRMKSVAKTRDGRLHLMYDLWFSSAAIGESFPK